MEMEDVLIKMVRLREMIAENQKQIKQSRADLREITDCVHNYMEEEEIQTITGVDGAYVVSLATSFRMPALTLGFIQECLAEYMRLNGPDANSVDAANFIVEQRKAQRKKVNRVQVRKQSKSQSQRPPALTIDTETETEKDAAVEKVPEQHGQHELAFVL